MIRRAPSGRPRSLRTPSWAYWLFSRPTLRFLFGWDLRSRDVRWVRPTPERVVEVGAGGGFYTGQLSRWVGPGGMVVALDPSGSALATLSARIGREVASVNGDGHCLPFASQSIDVLFYAYSLEEFHDPSTTLREAARVLRPDGQLLLFLWRPVLHGKRRRRMLDLVKRDFALERACDGLQNIRRSYRRR